MTVKVLKSTNAGAPVLTGQAGSLIALLDAALVNGYTINNWAGSTVYAANAVVKPTVANGHYYECTAGGGGASDATEPTWPTTAGGTVVDGAITWTEVGAIIGSLGWTKPFTGTNKAAYQNSVAAGATGFYLRVQDDQTTYAHRAYVMGFEAMTTVDAGTLPFPSATMTYSGWAKSNTADATARPWILVGDQSRFYLFVNTGEYANGPWVPYFFGDIISYVTGDAHRCMLAARYNTAGASSFSSGQDYLTYSYNNLSTSTQYLAMPKDHVGSVGPINVGVHTDAVLAGSPGNSWWMGAQGVLAFPNVANNGLFMAPVWVHQGTSSPYILRGYMPGMWCPMHSRPLADQDTFSGSGTYAGKTFLAINTINTGQIFIETSDTWS